MLTHERGGKFDEAVFVRNGEKGEFSHAPRFLFRRSHASKRETVSSFSYRRLTEGASPTHPHVSAGARLAAKATPPGACEAPLHDATATRCNGRHRNEVSAVGEASCCD